MGDPCPIELKEEHQAEKGCSQALTLFALLGFELAWDL
jgi:hypothetical protein